MLYVVKNTDYTFLKNNNCFSVFSFKNKCDNNSENNFMVVTENIPCGSTGTTCSKAVRVQLGVSAKDVGSYPQLHSCVFSTLQAQTQIFLILESGSETIEG